MFTIIWTQHTLQSRNWKKSFPGNFMKQLTEHNGSYMPDSQPRKIWQRWKVVTSGSFVITRWVMNVASPSKPQRASWTYTTLGLYSLSGKTSYCKISWSLEVARFCLDFFNRSEIWQAPRQQCCRAACQISERCDNYSIQSRGFETSLDLAVRRFTAKWIEALYSAKKNIENNPKNSCNWIHLRQNIPDRNLLNLLPCVFNAREQSCIMMVMRG